MENIIENLSVKSREHPHGDLILEVTPPTISINISSPENYTEEQLKEQAVIHFRAAYFRND